MSIKYAFDVLIGGVGAVFAIGIPGLNAAWIGGVAFNGAALAANAAEADKARKAENEVEKLIEEYSKIKDKIKKLCDTLKFAFDNNFCQNS